MMRSLCCALALGLTLIAPAFLEAGPQTAMPQQVDPFYLKMLDAGERSLRAGAFTEAARDLEIAVFGLGRSPRLTGKAYLLLAACRDALLDKDKGRSNLATAAGLLGPEGAVGLDLDERTLAVVRNLVETYKIPLALPPPPAPVKVEPKPAPTPPAPKIEKAPPETKKVPQEKKKEEAGKPKTREVKPAPKNEAKTTPPLPASKVEKTVPEEKKPSDKREEKEKPKKPETKPEAKKVPTKTEAAPPEKEKPTPGKEPAKIEGPKPVFRAPGESLPDVRELEKSVAADPTNAALVYEIVPRYFERKDFRAARRALEGLRAKRPLELRGRLLLAKADFFLKDYSTSLEELRAISSPASKARPGPADSRTISLFTAFCLAYLDQLKSAASILEPLRAGLTPEQFAALIEAEGLAAHWALISPRFRK